MLLSKIKKDTVGKNVELMLCYSYLISIVIKYNQNWFTQTFQDFSTPQFVLYQSKEIELLDTESGEKKSLWQHKGLLDHSY